MPSALRAAGGAGWVLAQWAKTGEAPMDLWVVDIRRFSDLHKDRDWTCARTLEAYAKHYTIGFPHEEYESGRPRIVSPLYERLKARNACFGSKLGWERPNWFAPEGVEPKDIYLHGPAELVRRGRRASIALCASAVGVFDQSSFAKFEMRGRDAAEALSWICANDVAKAPGRVVYTQIAQFARRHRMRPDRRAAGGGSFLHRDRHRLPHP